MHTGKNKSPQDTALLSKTRVFSSSQTHGNGIVFIKFIVQFLSQLNGSGRLEIRPCLCYWTDRDVDCWGGGVRIYSWRGAEATCTKIQFSRDDRHSGVRDCGDSHRRIYQPHSRTLLGGGSARLYHGRDWSDGSVVLLSTDSGFMR